jgi:hypothetical protein
MPLLSRRMVSRQDVVVRHDEHHKLRIVTMHITVKIRCMVALHQRCCALSFSAAVSLHAVYVDSLAALRYNTTWTVTGEGCFFSNAFASEEIDEKRVAIARLGSKNYACPSQCRQP